MAAIYEGIDGWKFDKRCWQIVGADVARRCGRFFDARGSITGKPITREGMHEDVGSG